MALSHENAFVKVLEVVTTLRHVRSASLTCQKYRNSLPILSLREVGIMQTGSCGWRQIEAWFIMLLVVHSTRMFMVTCTLYNASTWQCSSSLYRMDPRPNLNNSCSGGAGELGHPKLRHNIHEYTYNLCIVNLLRLLLDD